MSILAKASAACAGCGRRHETDIYKSINVEADPQLHEKVRNGSLFLWECPDCGHLNLLKYDTLYHDPVGKLMVWLACTEEIPQNRMQDIAGRVKSVGGGYILRTVPDAGGLIEKVLVHDAGLDDVTVELCKYVVKMEMAASQPEERAHGLMSAPFRFHRMEGEGDASALVLTYPCEGRMVEATIGRNVYDDCLGIVRRNSALRPAYGFPCVDSDWIASVMK